MDVNEELRMASRFGDVESVRRLLHEGLDVYKKAALHVALRCGNRDAMKLLMRTKCDVNAQDERGRTALHYASRGHTDVVKLLLEAKCDVNIQDKRGQTALHVASHSGSEEVVELLLSYQRDANRLDNVRNTIT